MVPLELSIDPNQITDIKHIIWKNPTPGSTLYCRPMLFECAKETNGKTRCVVSSLKEEIGQLRPTKVETEAGTFLVSVNMKLTMIDGKVYQDITETPSAATCYICGATPKYMSKLDLISKREENEEYFKYGLSTLHAWIRFFECILLIAYRLDFCQWQAIAKEKKELMQKAKKRI